MTGNLEPSQYPKYQVRLVNPLYWVLTGTKLWGEWIWLDEWTEFDGERLRKKHGERRWALRLAYAGRLTRFEIEGIAEDGKPVALSKWKIREESRQGVPSGVNVTSGPTEEFREVRGLPETVVAYHLRDHRRLSPDATVREMHRQGYPEVNRGNVARKRGYGRDAVRKKGACPACQTQENGRKRTESVTMA